MLTNDELAEIEAWVGNPFIPNPLRVGPGNTVLALVGELRAERTRTETLRDLLLQLAPRSKHGHKCHTQPWFELQSCTCGLQQLLARVNDMKVHIPLAASVEEPA